MLSSRHQSAVKEIDAARCVGNWSTASTLAAKLPRNGSPGHDFSSIVCSEAELEEYLLSVKWDPLEHWKDDGTVQAADSAQPIIARYPMNISGSGGGGDKLLDGLEKRLQKVSKHTLTDEEKYQLQVVLAKVYFYGAKFDQCNQAVELLPTALPDEGTLSPAYAKQLYMAQMVMRGIAAEIEGDRGAAHTMYNKAVLAFKERLSSQAAIVVPRGSVSGSERGFREELVNWPEEALYRRAMMSLTLGDTASGVGELGSYISVMDNVTPPTFRVFRRLRANRLYMQMVRQRLGGDAAAQPPSAEVKDDVMLSHRRQLALLKATYAFPRASETHNEVLYEVDCAARDWELVQGFSRTDSLRLLEILYESVYLTFNSPRVLRHLVHTLVRFGDYHEASLAFGTYRELAGRQLEGMKKAVSAAISEGTDADFALGADAESINSILRTTVVGARLFLVHLGNAHECLSLVHFANDLMDDVEARDPDHRIIPAVPQTIRAQVALWKGAAHGSMAQKSREPGNRGDHHGAALQLLQQAADLSPRLYDAHYYLALEQALGARDIGAATAAAKQAAALDPQRLEAWHLLVLLSTARKDYAKALQICEVAMRQSDWWAAYSEIQQSAGAEPVAAGGHSTDRLARGLEPPVKARLGSTESGMQFFELAMTHMAVEGRHRGYDASLEAQPQLFALYGCVYGPVIAAGDAADDVTSSMEGSQISIDALATGGPRTDPRGGAQHGRVSPSLASGRRSLARSLARSVFAKHARYSSHGGHAPLAADDGAAPDAPRPRMLAARADASPKRQRSMPHLRQASSDSAAQSPEIPAEAYFDSLSQLVGRVGSGRSTTVAHMHHSRSVYYTPVATRLGHRRARAKRALSALWLATAAAFVALQRLEEAAGAVAEALAAWPESPDARTLRGQLELAHARPAAALNEFHAAVSLEPSHIRASVALARVEHALGRRDVALGLLKNATRAHGWSDPEAWYWLGRLEHELALDHAAGSASRALVLRRALEYTAYALDLESSQPARPFSALRP